MKRFISIGLIIVFFLVLAYDFFDFVGFQPEQIMPTSNNTNILANQIFVFKSNKFTGRFLQCTGWPLIEYVDGRGIATTMKSTSEIQVVYPQDRMIVGEVVKGGFQTVCNAGLIFLDPKLSFHLFDSQYYPGRYTVENRVMDEYDFEDTLTALSPEFLKPENQ